MLTYFGKWAPAHMSDMLSRGDFPHLQSMSCIIIPDPVTAQMT